MKSLLLGATILVFVAALTASAAEFSCPSKGYYPDSNNTSNYYFCYEYSRNTYIAFKCRCQHGSYDPAAQRCTNLPATAPPGITTGTTPTSVTSKATTVATSSTPSVATSVSTATTHK